MSGFQQKEMEFLSRQAWDISAHLTSIRYTTLEPLQKELKGNQVLKGILKRCNSDCSKTDVQSKK